MPNKNISTNISIDEYACHHCHTLPPGFLDTDLQMNLEYQTMFRGFEEIRHQRGDRPITVNSGYRCEAYEQSMYDKYITSGRMGEVMGFLSVHMFGLALDLACDDWDDQARIVEIARSLTPRPRIGWRQYKSVGSKLVHIDYGFLIQPLPSTKLVSGVEW